MSTSASRALGALFSLAAFASVQQAQNSYPLFACPANEGGPLVFSLGEYYNPTAQYPVGTSAPGLFAAPNLTGAGAFPTDPAWGGSAVDQLTGNIWVSDGTTIAVEANRNYGAGSLPGLLSAPVALPNSGVVTGLAIDSANTSGLNPGGGPVLFVSDDMSSVWAYPLALPLVAPLAGPFAIPGLTTPTLDAVGLGFEPSSGDLWAIDAGGTVMSFVPGGAPTGAAVIAPIQGPFTGLTVNTSNAPAGPLTFPPPAFSAQLPGAYHVAATDIGGNLIDVFGFGAFIPPAPGIGGGCTCIGVGFSSDMQVSVGVGGGAPEPTLALTRPLTIGAVSPASLLVPGGPGAAGAAGLLLTEVVPSPVGFTFTGFLGTAFALLVTGVPSSTPLPITLGVGQATLNTLMLPGVQFSSQAVYGPGTFLPGGSGIFSELYTVTAGLL